MIKFLKKEKKNVLLLSILFLFLGFLILNTFQIPLLAETIMCGVDKCVCSCSSPPGGDCECTAGPEDVCFCFCYLPPYYVDFDSCNKNKSGPEMPI